MVKAQRIFLKRLADNIKKDPKSFFAYTRSKTRKKDSVGPLVDIEGKVTTDSVKTANVLNDYFASVFTDEVTDNLPEPIQIVIKTMEESLQNVEFTTDVVLKKLLQLKPLKPLE